MQLVTIEFHKTKQKAMGLFDYYFLKLFYVLINEENKQNTKNELDFLGFFILKNTKKPYFQKRNVIFQKTTK